MIGRLVAVLPHKRRPIRAVEPRPLPLPTDPLRRIALKAPTIFGPQQRIASSSPRSRSTVSHGSESSRTSTQQAALLEPLMPSQADTRGWYDLLLADEKRPQLEPWALLCHLSKSALAAPW